MNRKIKDLITDLYEIFFRTLITAPLKQAQLAGVKFVGACWDSIDKEVLNAQTDIINHPMELIKFIQ